MTEARSLAINCQQLPAKISLAGKAGARSAIERIGYVQIDTISVIERAHHHVLWTRVDGYQPSHLVELEEQDRAVFEYWAHAASYLPIEHYRFTLPRKAAFLQSDGHWFPKDHRTMRYVLDRIKAEGPLMSKDFKPQKKNKPASSGMDWGRNPMNLALRQLFMEGRIMVTHRRGFQKVYDLPENVLPAEVDTRMPDQRSYLRYLIERDIAAHGLLKSREIGYLLKGTGLAVQKMLEELVDAGELLECTVAGRPDDVYYTRPDLLETAATAPPLRELHLLSPFDNLVIQRQRLSGLFGFDYVLECYVPAKKRKTGYFCLPLLWGTEFAGQIDLKTDRKDKVLWIKNLVLETGVDREEAFLAALRKKLAAFAKFNKCEKIEFFQDLGKNHSYILD